MGKVKADSNALLLSLEFEDATGTPVEDDGRDDSEESGLDTAEWSSLLGPGSAGWSCAREQSFRKWARNGMRVGRGGAI